MVPSVLFVSKPIAPPFHDGSKCLVRDVARELTRVEPIVLTTSEAPAIPTAPGARPLRAVNAYASSGGFTPAFSANLRAAGWVLFASRASVWHFVFAPNPRTSGVGRTLARIRRVPVVQTVASPPRDFSRPRRLFFGDIVVAQSAWTRARIEQSYDQARIAPPKLVVLPPPVPELTAPSEEARARARASIRVDAGTDYVIYPGDLETSAGARSTAELALRLAVSHPSAVTVFAYRRKTPRAVEVAAELATRLPPEKTRFVENAPDILALLAGARAVVFPVDDLWGKVDLPIVLLEAMSLGTPIVALSQGPLADLKSVESVSSLDAQAWHAQVTAVLDSQEKREFIRVRQRAELEARHRARSVARGYEDLYLELAERHGRVR